MSAFLVEDALCLFVKAMGVSAYDFDFRSFFQCRSPWRWPKAQSLILRIGALDHYDLLYQRFEADGFLLINNPEDHERASLLSRWYPLIEEWTPRSRCYQVLPGVDEILEDFECPVFIKGDRQTAAHSEKLCVARDARELEDILRLYEKNSVLHWQRLVCREFVPLQSVPGDTKSKVKPSYEFRTFWWKQTFVGAGHYWSEFTNYTWSAADRRAALDIAERAAKRLRVPFLVIDLAKTEAGAWIIIECNDGQESGYAGLSPFLLWQNIINEEKRPLSDPPNEESRGT